MSAHIVGTVGAQTELRRECPVALPPALRILGRRDARAHTRRAFKFCVERRPCGDCVLGLRYSSLYFTFIGPAPGARRRHTSLERGTRVAKLDKKHC